MTTTPHDSPDQSSDDGSPHDTDKPGAEIGMADNDRSTFEPEEDPEGHSPS